MRRFGLWFARTWPGTVLLDWTISRMPSLIPGARLRETDTLIAFEHPQPAEPVHILIVPKEPYRSILEVPNDATEFLRDLFDVVKSLVDELNLEDGAYRLVMNGGANQEVKHLHFHLMSDSLADRTADVSAR